MDEKSKYESIIEDLQRCLKTKEVEIAQLRKNCENKKSMSKDEIEIYIQKHLPMLTPNQIKLMTKHKKRVNWNSDELAKGFASVYHSAGGHLFWTKNLQIPLPAIRTLSDWAGKISIAPGILSDVLLMLKGYVETLTEGERQVVLSLDEMACQALVKYHKGLDIVLGPHKEMQVMMVRGLTSKFKQPIFVDFDKVMSKDILFEVISELSYIGLNVVGVICDCGGDYMGLWSKLGIRCSRSDMQHSFKHPIIGENIYIFADGPHMPKLLRNWFLDGGFVLADGTVLKKQKVYDLLHHINTEITPAHKLSELHFSCSGVERMKVKLAAQLFSHTTATCLRRYYPDDEEARKLADFIDLVNKWFDVINSYTPEGPNVSLSTEEYVNCVHSEMQRKRQRKMIKFET